MSFSIRSKRLLALASSALLFSLAVFPANAQNAALGNISGVVRDASGAVIPNATVIVTNTGTGASRTITTNSDGYYSATFLQPGVYEVILGGGSFGKVDQKNVAVVVGTNATVDATLPNASVSTDVTVSTEAPLLDTDKVAASQVISETLVSNLPVKDAVSTTSCSAART
jgi:alkyl hydroperoxide reductase subunit AhpF